MAKLNRKMRIKAALFSVLLFCVVFASIWGRLTPLVIKDSEIENARELFPGGALLSERVVDWKRRDCTNVSIQAVLVDRLGSLHPLQSQDVGPPHLETKVSREWGIPLTMPSGPATYRATLTFQCFPFYSLWPITVQMPPVQFTVRSAPR